MYLRSAILKNTGPIQNLCISLPFEGERPKPVLMVGKNGSGKSTLISFVVNALVAMKQQVFDDVEVEKGRVYRIRSPLAIYGDADFFFAKLKFDKDVVLAEWQLNRLKSDIPDQSLYQNIDPSWNQIQLNDTSAFLPNYGELADIRQMEEMLNKNCLLFFPADRFEPPDWLNISDLATDLKLPEPERMKGKTSRRILSRNRLKPTLDWLNSIIFDMMVTEYQDHVFPLANPSADGNTQTDGHRLVPVRIKAPGKAHAVFNAISEVLKQVLCDKETDSLTLGIGDRKSRIINATILRDGQPVRVIKDLMSLSAGESALFCLFASIIRDADLSDMSFTSPANIQGIVVIDEVDMHLHVGLQYRVLPELLALFPRVQFILSAHAPMVAIGLENKLGENGFEIIELPSATRITTEVYSEFRDAFQVFSETRSFQDAILETIRTTGKPILLLEGKTDAQLIATAWTKLYPNVDMPFEAIPCGVEPDAQKRSGGSNMLRQSLEFLSAIVDVPVCGVFDFDRAGYEAFAGLKKNVFNSGSDFSHKKHISKNTHAILLPVPAERMAFVNKNKPPHSFLAIEHYFSNDILQEHGFSMDPVIAGASIFEIDASAKVKTVFASEAVDLDVSHFQNFSLLFDRLSTIGLIQGSI